MAKATNYDAYDAALAYYGASNLMHFCTGQPLTNGGITALSVGNIAPTFTAPTAGTTSGRRIGVNAVAGVPVTVSGGVTHVVITGSGDLSTAKPRFVTTDPNVAVLAGGTLTVSAWTIEIPDPV